MVRSTTITALVAAVWSLAVIGCSPTESTETTVANAPDVPAAAQTLAEASEPEGKLAKAVLSVPGMT